MFQTMVAESRTFELVRFAARVNAQCSVLSNFAVTELPLLYENVEYPSVEHAYVNLNRFDGHYTEYFQVGGVLSSFECLYAWWKSLKKKPFPKTCLPKKQSWRGMDGVIAKMAANLTSDFGRGVRRALCMHMPTLDVYSDSDNELWRGLHAAKARASVCFQVALWRTREAYLYEFDKGKAKEVPSASPWGAYYNKESGAFYGQNVMGRLLMDTRKRLLDYSLW